MGGQLHAVTVTVENTVVGAPGRGAELAGAEPTGAAPDGAEAAGDEPTGAAPDGVEGAGTELAGAEPTGEDGAGEATGVEDPAAGDEPTGLTPVPLQVSAFNCTLLHMVTALLLVV